MATIYLAPKGFEAPRLTIEDYRERRYEAISEAYVARLAAEARKGQPHADPLIGRVVRFPIADGYAEYIVWRLRPLQLVKVELGDAWDIPNAYARGLRVSDIRAQVEAEDRLRAYFKERQEAKA